MGVMDWVRKGDFCGFAIWMGKNNLSLRGGFLDFRYSEGLPRPKFVRTNPPIPLQVTHVTTRSGEKVT